MKNKAQQVMDELSERLFDAFFNSATPPTTATVFESRSRVPVTGLSVDRDACGDFMRVYVGRQPSREECAELPGRYHGARLKYEVNAFSA
jgi:hypothetical protein